MLRRVLSLLAAVIAIALMSACASTGQKPRLEQIFAEADNKSDGFLVISNTRYTKRQRNIEEEIWNAVMTIRNNGPVSSNCNVLLRVFNINGMMLDEYLLFNDMLGYESSITYRDEIYIKGAHLDQISFAMYHYNCVKKDILGR